MSENGSSWQVAPETNGVADPHRTVLAGGLGSGRWSELWGRGCRVGAWVVGVRFLAVFEGWGLVKAYSGPQGAPRVWTPARV